MRHVNKLKQQVYQLMYLLDDHVSYLRNEAETYVGTCLRVSLFRVATRVKLETLVAHIHTLSLSFRYQQRARNRRKKDGPRAESHFTIITEGTLPRFSRSALSASF